MREYNFRGKNNKKGWVYGTIKVDRKPNKIEWFIIDDFGKNWLVPETTIGQDTNMKDSHSNNLFEGDIVRDDVGCVFEVSFIGYSASYGFVDVKNRASICSYLGMVGFIEKIGNKIDNPELRG